VPSFDLISKLDMGELKNALNMAVKQITGRYDFKGSNVSLDLLKNDSELLIKAEDEYKMKAALDIFYGSMGKRGLGLKGLEVGDIEPTGNQMYKQTILIKSGIDKDQAKIMNKLIKESKLKVSSQYLDEKIRVTSKKIDELQATFKLLREHKDVNIDLTMENIK
jgi:uncharacterized protein YajQ (UPF0234 family)